MSDRIENSTESSNANVFSRFLPQLSRPERLELAERIHAGAGWGADFVVMMVLATGLASLGLLQDSSAVVIGAMLVAPLMGPLIGAGLALVQGNPALFRNAISVVGAGIAMGFLISAGIGMLNPGYEATMEIEARGTPDVMDLLIALASGMVAAYASARPNVSGTMAGVAIAAALLPPLAVVGIGLTNGRSEIALNAAVLLLTNIVAIVLGAAFIFVGLGIHGARKEGAPEWVYKTVIGLLLVSIALLPILLSRVSTEARIGQSRPLTYPVSARVRNAVEKYMDEHPTLELISMGRISVEPKSGTTLVLSASEPIPETFKRELSGVVQLARGDNAPVRVFALIEAYIRDETQ